MTADRWVFNLMVIGGLAIAHVVAADDAPPVSHKLLTTGVRGTAVLSTAIAACPQGCARGFFDVSTYDDLGNSLGDTHHVEMYGARRVATVQTTGDLTFTDRDGVASDSYMSVTPTGATQPVLHYIASDPVSVGAAAALSAPTLDEPRDADRDGAVAICLEHVSTGNCDYSDVGVASLRVPLKGSVAITDGDFVIDAALIKNRYQAPGATAPGDIYLLLGASGAECALSAQELARFWQHVTVAPDDHPAVLSWDLAGDPSAWADFGAACRAVQDEVYLTMSFAVPYANTATGATGTIPLTISNLPVATPLFTPSLSFAPMLRLVAGPSTSAPPDPGDPPAPSDPDPPVAPGMRGDGDAGCAASGGGGTGGWMVVLAALLSAVSRRASNRERCR